MPSLDPHQYRAIIASVQEAHRAIAPSLEAHRRLLASAQRTLHLIRHSVIWPFDLETMYRRRIHRQGSLSPLHPQKVLGAYPPTNPRGLRKHHPDLIAKYGPYCQGCSVDVVESPDLLEVDHIRPRIDGGTSEFNNLALLCPTCNRKKGSYFTLTGLQARLVNSGVSVRRHLIREGRFGRANKPEEWIAPDFPEIVVHLRPLEKSVADFAAFVVKQKTDQLILQYKDVYDMMPRTLDHQMYLKYERMDPTITLPYACIRIENTADRKRQEGLSRRDVINAPALFVQVLHREIVDRYEKNQSAKLDLP